MEERPSTEPPELDSLFITVRKLQVRYPNLVLGVYDRPKSVQVKLPNGKVVIEK